MLGRRKTNAPRERRTGVKLTLHPLFFLAGIVYAFTGDLPLFLMSCFVAVQHECAHAFAAAKLGYTLNKIVLMPFGAVIDGDLNGLSKKDETTIALWGPLCNLITAGFFVALWWCFPVTYAYTDVACYTSLTIALINLLPAYPLDGGRILRCNLLRVFEKRYPLAVAEKRAFFICKLLSLVFAVLFILAYFYFKNFSLITFGVLLFVGALGKQGASYTRMDFSLGDALLRGVEIKRVAISATCPIKNALKFVQNGTYLVLEVYDQAQRHLFDLSQNELSALFAFAPSPYTTLQDLRKKNG